MSTAIALGICTAPEKVPQLAPGFDYVELSVSSSLIPLEDDAAFAPKHALLEGLEPPARAFNIFVPPKVKLTGPEVDWELVHRYVDCALRRVAALGGQLIVFGSGGARNVPEGFSHALAWGQLVRFLNLCADIAETRDITIAIEPLNRGESNIVNSYLEGVQLARDVDRDRIRVLADLYHFMMDAEALDDILKEPDHLAHVHVADTMRGFPGSGAYPLERLFDILREIGYHGKVSIECRWGDDLTDESGRALRFLRGLSS